MQSITCKLRASTARVSLALTGLFSVLALSACMTLPSEKTALANGKVADAALPTEQYPLAAQTHTRSINLRVNPNGLSDNQKLALSQLAGSVSWTNGQAGDISIVTAGDPVAVAAGQSVGTFLVAHDVDASVLSQSSRQDQPANIITVNITEYRAQVYACNQSWENLARTGENGPYNNFGCTTNANLAAMVADPRDLAHPQAATPTDAARKSVTLDKYRKGDITSSAQDEQSKATVANAVQ